MKLNSYQGTIENREGFLYENGKTEYTILLPENALEAEKFAAQELTGIFAKAGVSIATVTDAGLTADPTKKYIAVGDTVYFRSLGIKMLQREFKFDGFVIESVGETYVVKGITDTGTCFGVYGFCEYAMGYVYYAWDEYKIDTAAPNKEFHLKDVPTFLGRYAYSYETYCKEKENYPDHAFRLRINGNFTTPKAHHGESTPWSSLHDMSMPFQILNHEVYEKDHPDWYYRKPEYKDSPFPRSAPQLCISKGLEDGEFFETFVQNLINNYIIPEENKIFFMLGISDNRGECVCPECQKEIDKYTSSGLNMRFVNRVADRVEAWRKGNAPDRVIYLLTFAYLYTFDAPVVEKDGKFVPIDESVIARDNVLVLVAPIGANYVYPIMDETYNASSKASLLGWKTVAKNLALWDYRADYNTFWFPQPTTQTAQANMDTYYEMGMIDVFNQGQTWGRCAFVTMDDFARSRMHWNMKEKYDDLTDEFRKAYYKEAEPYVTEYLRALEDYHRILVERGWTGSHRQKLLMLRKYLHTVEDMYRFRDILDKAMAAAKSEVVRDRVLLLTLFYKAVLIGCFVKDIPQEEAKTLIDDVRRSAKKLGITEYTRRDTTEEFLAEVEDLLAGKITEEERKFYLRYPSNMILS